MLCSDEKDFGEGSAAVTEFSAETRVSEIETRP